MLSRPLARIISCAFRFLVLSAIMATCAFEGRAQATEFTWTGVGTDVSDAANWTPGGGPPHVAEQTNIAHFGAAGSTSPTLAANTNFWVQQLIFDVGRKDTHLQPRRESQATSH